MSEKTNCDLTFRGFVQTDILQIGSVSTNAVLCNYVQVFIETTVNVLWKLIVFYNLSSSVNVLSCMFYLDI